MVHIKKKKKRQKKPPIMTKLLEIHVNSLLQDIHTGSTAEVLIMGKNQDVLKQLYVIY